MEHDADLDKYTNALKKVQLEIQHEQTKKFFMKILERLDHLSHDEIVELYNALVVRLARYK